MSQSSTIVVLLLLVLVVAAVAAPPPPPSPSPESKASYLSAKRMRAGVGGGLFVSDFDRRPASATPGNVGLCFSGGGARSLSASLGQMRALHQLGVLKQVKAISSVSGGSWATIPYTFLPPHISDETFLGPYVADPHDLHIGDNGDDTPGARVDVVTSPMCLSAAIANQKMGAGQLADQADKLRKKGVPSTRLWIDMVSEHVLGTFGLNDIDASGASTKFFCANQRECDAILTANPHLARNGYHMVRDGRPYHIINTAMFVTVPSIETKEPFAYLAPVAITPYFSGIFSAPPGAKSIKTAHAVGSGAVQSFAFGGEFKSSSNDNIDVTVSQEHVFGLGDAAGATSAAFAELLESKLHVVGLNPTFGYFSAEDIKLKTPGAIEKFADGGSLENSGVAAMLAYQDIDSIIVFINSAEPMSDDESTSEVSLSHTIAPLFGIQPYSKENGYVPYPKTSEVWSSRTAASQYRFNQVFETSEFELLQQGLLAATTNDGQSAISTAPSVFLQTGLKVLSNPWFGVPGGNFVNVLWVYNQPSSEWTDQLREPVRLALEDTSKFPFYSTVNTGLDAFKVNMLAHFSSYVLMQHKEEVLALFQDDEK